MERDDKLHPAFVLVSLWLELLKPRLSYPERNFAEAFSTMISPEPDMEAVVESMLEVCLVRGLPHPFDPVWQEISVKLDRLEGPSATVHQSAVEMGVYTCMTQVAVLCYVYANGFQDRIDQWILPRLFA